MASRRLASATCILLLGLAGLLAGACQDAVDQEVRDVDLAGFTVTFVDDSETALGTRSAPLLFPVAFARADGSCPVVVGTDEQGNPIEGCQEVALDIEARRFDNSVNTDLDEHWVELRVIPGEIAPADRYVKLVDGVAENHRVRIRFAYGPARIWVEDTGIQIEEDASGRQVLIDQCEDGIDNDDNGLIDFPTDPSCDSDSTSEGSGTYVTGISDELFFELPTVRSVQFNPDTSTGPSPLTGQFVEIQGRTGHDLVVTNVVSTGFYVTDVSEQGYNSIFIFNFSFPEDVEIGDRICDVGGGVTEFNALTQLQFPSWAIQGKPRSTSEQRLPNPEDEEDQLIDEDIEFIDCSQRYGVPAAPFCETDADCETPAGCNTESNHCITCTTNGQCGEGLHCNFREGRCEISETVRLPDPVPLDGALLRDLTTVEQLESSLVTVTDVELSTLFVDCDDNGSGRIESGTREATCRSECNNNPYCTELSSLFGFDQWRGRVDGAEVSVASSKIAAGFDVLEGCERGENAAGRETYTCPPRTLKRVTGSLRQIVPTCDRFLPCDPAEEGIILLIIEPRFDSDIIE